MLKGQNNQRVRKRLTFSGLSLGGLLALILAAQPVSAQTMEESLATAYSSNPSLLATRSSLRATNEGVPQALSNWRPQVVVNAQVGKGRNESTGPFSVSDVQNITPRGASLTVSQFLYRGGQTVAETAQAEADVLAGRSQLLSSEQNVLFAAATAYLNVWRDQSILELTINNEQVLERQLEASRDRFEVGEITRTDVAQSESRLSRATAERITAEGSLAISRAIFQEVVGVFPQVLDEPAAVQGLPVKEEDVVALALANSPDVLSAQYNEIAAQHQVRATFGQLLPELLLQGDLSYTDETSLEDSDNKQAQILALLNIPLYQQGAVSSQVRATKQVANQLRLLVDEARRSAEQEGISSWEDLLTSQAQIKSFESEVQSTGIALEGVRQENQVGARTVLDVLDAEQEFLDAQVNLVRAKRDEYVARYAVLSSVGKLTASELALPVPIYDPDVDYRAVRDKWYGIDAPGTE